MKIMTSALLFLIGFCVSARADERALLVGIGRYNPPIKELPGIDLDIATQQETLRAFGFRSDQIHVLREDQATDANILHEIQTWLTDGVQPNDRVVFYYSGHGTLGPDASGKNVGMLVPHNLTAANGVLSHAISGTQLRTLVEKIPSRHVLLILDSCNSGNLTDRSKSLGDVVVPKFFSYPGMPNAVVSFLEEEQSKGISTSNGSNHLLLSACQKSQVAGASDHGSHLTVALSEQVKMALNQGQPIKLNLLEPEIEKNVLDKARGQKDPQRPELAGSKQLEGYDWSKGIVYDPQPVVRVQPRQRPSQTAPPAQDWSLLTWAYEQRAGDLGAKLNAKLFHRNGRMTATVQIPADGYLNVIALGQGDQTATVLFPNEYQQDNRVTAGSLILPQTDDYHWEQALPSRYSAQLNKVLFLFSAKNVNMFQLGIGKDAFRAFSQDSRSTVVKASYGFTAALLDYTIAK